MRVKTLLAEIPAAQRTEYLVHGHVRRQRAVEYAELPLEPGRHVIPAAARVDHRAQHVHAYDVHVVSGFRQRVEALVLKQLTRYLVRYLQPSTRVSAGTRGTKNCSYSY